MGFSDYIGFVDLPQPCQGTGSASDATAAISAPEPMEVDGKSTDELMTALRASRDQVPVLNVDGVCVFLGSAVSNTLTYASLHPFLP
jgi:hypothetical protein